SDHFKSSQIIKSMMPNHHITSKHPKGIKKAVQIKSMMPNHHINHITSDHQMTSIRSPKRHQKGTSKHHFKAPKMAPVFKTHEKTPKYQKRAF
ncbi:MAG: hypothetical protein AAFU49_24695, partial [Pseudomonadota bacterium]